MRVAALSLAGVDTKNIKRYRQDLLTLLGEKDLTLAVLPAHTALLLFCGLHGKDNGDFSVVFQEFKEKAGAWNDQFLSLHADLAKSLGTTLVAGTTLEEEAGCFYQTAYGFNPRGEICVAQRQTHLSREERSLGLSRGVELHLFEAGGLKAGIVPGTDAYHPEVGRIFALLGAALVIHPGALPPGEAGFRQAAGMWAQVQQNQFWAVEAQLNAKMCGRNYGGECRIIGPCEVSSDLSGFLSRVPAGSSAAVAVLDEAARQRIKKTYPLLELLHPGAYGDLSTPS